MSTFEMIGLTVFLEIDLAKEWSGLSVRMEILASDGIILV